MSGSPSSVALRAIDLLHRPTHAVNERILSTGSSMPKVIRDHGHTLSPRLPVAELPTMILTPCPYDPIRAAYDRTSSSSCCAEVAVSIYHGAPAALAVAFPTRERETETGTEAAEENDSRASHKAHTHRHPRVHTRAPIQNVYLHQHRQGMHIPWQSVLAWPVAHTTRVARPVTTRCSAHMYPYRVSQHDSSQGTREY